MVISFKLKTVESISLPTMTKQLPDIQAGAGVVGPPTVGAKNKIQNAVMHQKMEM